MHIKLRYKLLIIFILIIACLILSARYIGPRGLNLNEHNIINNKIPESFYGLKIIQFSDLYYKSTTFKDDLDIISNTINKAKPDIVLFTGDIMDPNITYSDQDINDLTMFFKSINANIEKYSIKGDNDINNKYWESIMNDSNFINLCDDYKYIYYKGFEPILLLGISSNNKDVNNSVEEIKKKLDTEYKYSILVLHEPDYIKDVKGFDLYLASHSLNGNINLPFIGGVVHKKGYMKYVNEYYDFNESELYITGGIGTNSKFKFRLFNKPSINLYRLRNK